MWDRYEQSERGSATVAVWFWYNLLIDKTWSINQAPAHYIPGHKTFCFQPKFLVNQTITGFGFNREAFFRNRVKDKDQNIESPIDFRLGAHSQGVAVAICRLPFNLPSAFIFQHHVCVQIVRVLTSVPVCVVWHWCPRQLLLVSRSPADSCVWPAKMVEGCTATSPTKTSRHKNHQ